MVINDGNHLDNIHREVGMGVIPGEGNHLDNIHREVGMGVIPVEGKLLAHSIDLTLYR